MTRSSGASKALDEDGLIHFFSKRDSQALNVSAALEVQSLIRLSSNRGFRSSNLSVSLMADSRRAYLVDLIMFDNYVAFQIISNIKCL